MRTLTLKNVPDELYDELKAQAAAHRRSLNQEVICRLEGGGERRPEQQLLRELEEIRNRQARRGVFITEEIVDAFIVEGRT